MHTIGEDSTQGPTMIALLLLACAAEPTGLLATPDGTGPIIRFDYDAEPLPDIPFPNDLATRSDPTSVTGLRLNIATHSHTLMEEEARLKVNELMGFGVYAPISVGFEGRIDIDAFAARHKDDPRYGFERLDDDAIYVINIDPKSERYGEFVEVDIGEGRFPMDAARSDRYFPNDTRALEPSAVYDTVDEDLNGNGVLDWGEDTDNDGILDIPNIWPTGGDPRADLLSWYELASDTLIMRPIVPMAEESMHAVVITDRLVDMAGEPVRSPWKWVHHLAQTEGLSALDDVLAPVGLSMDDVAFAWTFTTGRVTGDLVDIQRGLQGEGPFASLQADYPVGVTEAGVLHSIPGLDPHLLPAQSIFDVLIDLGFFNESAKMLIDDYEHFSEALVGGVYHTPTFLVDQDGDGDWHEESFVLDPHSGEMLTEAERIAFTCMLPKETEEFTAPFPTVMYLHGYGGSRFEFLGFAHALNRLGFAVCASDAPGHGPTVDAETLALMESLLNQNHLWEFYGHLLDARHRDLNNDGIADSGDDQWSADAFHTRDMVRQSTVDTMWMLESLKRCGEGEMAMQDGTTRMSCDWDDDGVPDIGTADGEYFFMGGSLGGINVGVSAGVVPGVTAWIPVVSGAGLVDVGTRTEIGGAVEAMIGRMISPLILGTPTEDGGLSISLMVNSNTSMVSLHVGTMDSFPAGGRVIVENIENGLISEGYLPEDGTFRLAIAADALDAIEKRFVTGLLPGTPEVVEDPTLLGDALVIRIEEADGTEVATFDTWEDDVLHEGVLFPAGSTLVAGNEGLGHIRATPQMHRVARVFASILEPGDPAAYAPYYLNGHPGLDNGPQNVLIAPSIGDTIVNVSTGIAHARAAGLISRDKVDDRWGLSEDQYLIDRRVVQGLEEWGPYTNSSGEPILFDPDDLDDGADIFEEPSDVPLRATVETDAGVSGLRHIYVSPTGTHGFGMPDPSRAHDMNTHAIFLAASYFHFRGQKIPDDPCLQDASCDWIPPLPWEYTGPEREALGPDLGMEVGQ